MRFEKSDKIHSIDERDHSSDETVPEKEPMNAPLDAQAPLQRFRAFADGLKHGMKVEWHETRAVPGQLLRGEFRKAGEQVADLGRMSFLALLWVLPGGAVISAFVVKVFHRIRPSAFRHRRHDKRDKEDKCD
jgi:hypothetical protein